ncbi:MAG TPA: hypothetical protein VMK16_14325, partial [Acidimicrobiales bacterium]|nr:hypothetical protein [Acidimicrobiales bacterium]
TGGSSSAAGLTVKATEYKFDVSGSAGAGYNKVTFENDGKMPHILVAIKLQPGKTVKDALPLLEQEGEPDPAAAAAVFDGDPSTAFYGTPGLISPGVTETTFADFPAGNYAFVCFLPGPGGQPHFMLGMATDFTVADSGGSDTPPQTAGTITIAADKITAPEGMKSGTYEVKNTGSDPSDFNLAGPTDAQVSDFDNAVNGFFNAMVSGEEDAVFQAPAPIFGGLSDTIPAGKSGYVQLDLTKGRYLMAGNSDQDTGKTLVSGEFTVS